MWTFRLPKFQRHVGKVFNQVQHLSARCQSLFFYHGPQRLGKTFPAFHLFPESPKVLAWVLLVLCLGTRLGAINFYGEPLEPGDNMCNDSAVSINCSIFPPSLTLSHMHFSTLIPAAILAFNSVSSAPIPRPGGYKVADYSQGTVEAPADTGYQQEPVAAEMPAAEIPASDYPAEAVEPVAEEYKPSGYQTPVEEVADTEETSDGGYGYGVGPVNETKTDVDGEAPVESEPELEEPTSTERGDDPLAQTSFGTKNYIAVLWGLLPFVL